MGGPVQPSWKPAAYVPPQVQPTPQTVAPKSAGISVLLSFFIPGLGSMINGRAGKGVAILLIYIAGWILSLVLIGIPIALGAWIWGMVDGYTSAQAWNRAHGILT